MVGEMNVGLAAIARVGAAMDEALFFKSLNGGRYGATGKVNSVSSALIVCGPRRWRISSRAKSVGERKLFCCSVTMSD